VAPAATEPGVVKHRRSTLFQIDLDEQLRHGQRRGFVLAVSRCTCASTRPPAMRSIARASRLRPSRALPGANGVAVDAASQHAASPAGIADLFALVVTMAGEIRD
jgi:hypothetical protein